MQTAQIEEASVPRPRQPYEDGALSGIILKDAGQSSPLQLISII